MLTAHCSLLIADILASLIFEVVIYEIYVYRLTQHLEHYSHSTTPTSLSSHMTLL